MAVGVGMCQAVKKRKARHDALPLLHCEAEHRNEQQGDLGRSPPCPHLPWRDELALTTPFTISKTLPRSKIYGAIRCCVLPVRSSEPSQTMACRSAGSSARLKAVSVAALWTKRRSYSKDSLRCRRTRCTLADFASAFPGIDHAHHASSSSSSAASVANWLPFHAPAKTATGHSNQSQ